MNQLIETFRAKDANGWEYEVTVSWTSPGHPIAEARLITGPSAGKPPFQVIWKHDDVYEVAHPTEITRIR